MSKTCEKCGKPMADEASVCENCGVQTEEAKRPSRQRRPRKKKGFLNSLGEGVGKFFYKLKTDKKVLILTVLAVLLLMVASVVIGVLLLIGNPPQKAVDSYIVTLYEGTGVGFLQGNKLKNLAPGAYWDYVEETAYGEKTEDVLDGYEEWWNAQKTTLENDVGKDLEVRFETDRTDKLSDATLKKIAQSLAQNYGIKESDVKEGKVIRGICFVTGDDKEDGWSATVYEITVVRVGFFWWNWYPVSWYEQGDGIYATFAVDTLVQSIIYRAY